MSNAIDFFRSTFTQKRLRKQCAEIVGWLIYIHIRSRSLRRWREKIFMKILNILLKTFEENMLMRYERWHDSCKKYFNFKDDKKRVDFILMGFFICLKFVQKNSINISVIPFCKLDNKLLIFTRTDILS